MEANVNHDAVMDSWQRLEAGIPSPTPRRRLRVFCTAAPVAFWGVYFGGIGLHDGGLGWKAEIWGGTLVWSSLTLLALGMVMFPPAVPTETAAGPE